MSKNKKPKYALILIFATIIGYLGMDASVQNSKLESQSTSYTEYILAGFTSFEEMSKSVDVIIKVAINQRLGKVEDFGADGIPDYSGQEGLPIQLTSAEVTSVLKGDRDLEGESITLSQLFFHDQTSKEFSDNDLIPGKEYLIFANLRDLNPGLPFTGPVFSPIATGQGIFEFLQNGKVKARRGGIWPDIFGPSGEREIHPSDLVERR